MRKDGDANEETGDKIVAVEKNDNQKHLKKAQLSA